MIGGEKMITKTTLVHKMMLAFSAITLSAASASAGIAEDLTNFTLITTNFSSMLNSILAVFLPPPLLYFVVLTIFIAIIGIVKRLMKGA